MPNTARQRPAEGARSSASQGNKKKFNYRDADDGERIDERLLKAIREEAACAEVASQPSRWRSSH
jgi:hypothetical protein